MSNDEIEQKDIPNQEQEKNEPDKKSLDSNIEKPDSVINEISEETESAINKADSIANHDNPEEQEAFLGFKNEAENLFVETKNETKVLGVSQPEKETQSMEAIKEIALNKAEELEIPVLNENNIDEILGDEPYVSHTIISTDENLIKILESEQLLSSEKSGNAAMTYESDKLIGMHNNVFFALGKGYMKKDKYAIIFNPKNLAKIPGSTFVENDLMHVESKVISDFLEDHTDEIIKIVEQYRTELKIIFEKKIEQYFQGGHGMYDKYFGENAKDRVQEFLDAIKTKGIKEIGSEEEVIDQFTILSDSVLSKDIMPPELREKLMNELQEKVIKPHTKEGKDNISEAIARIWQSDSEIKKFLPDERVIPEKIRELRVPNEIDLKKAIIGIFIPNAKQ